MYCNLKISICYLYSRNHRLALDRLFDLTNVRADNYKEKLLCSETSRRARQTANSWLTRWGYFYSSGGAPGSEWPPRLTKP